jgi:hypothetical protein
LIFSILSAAAAFSCLPAGRLVTFWRCSKKVTKQEYILSGSCLKPFPNLHNVTSIIGFLFCNFLSSQKVTKKDLTAGTRSGSFAGIEFAFSQTAGRRNGIVWRLTAEER